MSKKEEDVTSVTHRVATWAVIVPLVIYVLNMGMWVGAADEKFEDAKQVEEKVDALKVQVTRVEAEFKRHDDESLRRADAILKAIERIERDLQEEREHEHDDG